MARLQGNSITVGLQDVASQPSNLYKFLAYRPIDSPCLKRAVYHEAFIILADHTRTRILYP